MTKSIVEVCSDDLMRGDDGFLIFWPTSSRGAYTAQNLRDLADHIDAGNVEWEKQLNEYHAQIAP